MRDAITSPARRRATRPSRVLLLAAFASIALVGTVVHAQSEIDVEPPLVEHEPIEQGEPGDTQEFSATVVDDRELAEVLLFHRFAGEDSFNETPMRQVASSSVYTASVRTEASETRAIEYYIQARDEAGNRVIKGYAFSPLVRRMGDEKEVAGSDPSSEPVATSGGGRRWLYIGLGVLAVGAIAAAAGGGDDDDGDPDAFTVRLDPPG